MRIRAIRPDDKCLIVKAFNELEPESIYSRFFQRKTSLSEQELQKATELDFDNDVGLVVTIGEEDTETIIGSCRYAAYNTPDGTRCAEVAFTIEEDYHSQGMATILIQHLTAIARQKGIAQFTAEVLAQTIIKPDQEHLEFEFDPNNDKHWKGALTRLSHSVPIFRYFEPKNKSNLLKLCCRFPETACSADLPS